SCPRTTMTVAFCSVSKDFQDCRHFFYMQVPPGGLWYGAPSSICQRYMDQVHYATLYDTHRRLPIYSAYIFRKSDGKRRVDTPWMYESQLVVADETGNMRPLPLSEDKPPFIEDTQAVLEDYTDAIEYKRCPLNPDIHQAEPPQKSSIYTLTNVVPLRADLFDNFWNPYLDRIRRRLNNFCLGKTFVVTGVTAAGDNIRRDNRDRIGIPKSIWLAYCCLRFDLNSPYEVRYMFPSYAGYALNSHGQNEVVEVPLKTLESFIKSNTDVDVVIFYKILADLQPKECI
uniref:Uncharacterized protein n=1 Tax=Periophthalmus magnuspinnatus TaxID=409849 RepID=A0A3B4A940_9GOBI